MVNNDSKLHGGEMFIAKVLVLLTALGIHNAARLAPDSQPNLSGVWKTDSEKSQYPAHVGPLLIRVTIQQQGNQLKEIAEDSRTGEHRQAPMEFVYTLGGNVTTARIRGEVYRATAKWESATLVIVWRVNRGGAEAFVKRELSLSSDGKTLTMKIYSREDQKEPIDVLVMNKVQDSN